MSKDIEYFPSASEFNPPGNEFPSTGEEFSSGKSLAEKKKKKSLWLPERLLAIALCVFLVFGTAYITWNREISDTPSKETEPLISAQEPTQDPEIEQTTQIVTETTNGTEDPQETVADSGYREPNVKSLFISFSSEILGKLEFENSENIVNCKISVYDAVSEDPLDVFELTKEEIDENEYLLPVIYLDEYYFRYFDQYEETGNWPDPEFMIDFTILTEEGSEETKQITTKASDEQGWSVRYVPIDYPYPDIFTPGTITFKTYESFEPYDVFTDPDTELENEQAKVIIEIDGVRIESEQLEVTILKDPYYQWDENGQMIETGKYFYYSQVCLPLPSGITETQGSKVRVTVIQKLRNGEEWTTVKEFEIKPYN